MNNNLFNNDLNESLQWGTMEYLHEISEKNLDATLTAALNQLNNQIVLLENLISAGRDERKDTQNFEIQLFELKEQKQILENKLRVRSLTQEESKKRADAVRKYGLIITIVCGLVGILVLLSYL